MDEQIKGGETNFENTPRDHVQPERMNKPLESIGQPVKIKKTRKEEPHLLDKEIDIKIKPKKVLKGLLLIFLLVAAFFLGRFTAAPEESSGFNLTSLFSYFLPNHSAEQEETATESDDVLVKESAVEEILSDPEEDVQEETEYAEEIPVDDEMESTENYPVITNYQKVTITAEDFNTVWHSNWGEIVSFKYTIKNGEKGIIKPDHFIMNVEGYTDLNKVVPVSPSSRSISRLTTITSGAIIPDSFDYSSLVAGDLANVQITLRLYDAQNRFMGQFSKDFDLSHP